MPHREVDQDREAHHHGDDLDHDRDDAEYEGAFDDDGHQRDGDREDGGAVGVRWCCAGELASTSTSGGHRLTSPIDGASSTLSLRSAAFRTSQARNCGSEIDLAKFRSVVAWRTKYDLPNTEEVPHYTRDT
jgi:hypothetical protein